MSENLGIIEPNFFDYKEDFHLESGKLLKGFKIIYETYGSLNENKSKTKVLMQSESAWTCISSHADSDSSLKTNSK